MSWLKQITDPRARLESFKVDRLKRDGATKEEIERQRPEIQRQVAAMDSAEVKRQNDEAGAEIRDRVRLRSALFKDRQQAGNVGWSTPNEIRREVDALDIAGVRRLLDEQKPPMSRQQRRKAEELSKASKAWTLPAVLRHYESGKNGDDAFAEEASIWADHGYQPSMQSADGGHVNLGRAVWTGGLTVVAGRSRSKDKLTVTFTKQAVAAAAEPASATIDVPDQIAKFAALRDQGILTEEEFQAKKRELLKG